MSELNRRDFLLATGVMAVSLISLPVLQSVAEAAKPPLMPDKPVDAGLLSSFDKDGVTQKFAKKPNFFFVVRNGGKLYACLSMCTHKYRPLTVKSDEFYCPAHNSEFSYDGTVTNGPAENSLPRYAISVNAGGHVIVDCTQGFSEAHWDDPASFIAIK
jgi:cytochrome b6-f complex iron-sulfur subunit